MSLVDMRGNEEHTVPLMNQKNCISWQKYMRVQIAELEQPKEFA